MAISIAFKKIFSDDVVLFDPIVKVVKSKVLELNQNVFSDVAKIQFISQRIFVNADANTSIGELKIDFDGKLIEVVNIIEFDDSGEIARITAYLDT